MADIEQGTPAERAAALNMPYVDPERAVLLTVKRMCEDFHRTTDDPDLKRRINGAYERLIGAGIRNFAGDNDTFASIYFKGPPGHGKTSSIVEASKVFAKLIAAEHHTDPQAKSNFGANDLLLVSREFTGEVSTLASRGIFEKGDRNGVAVTKRVPYEDFVAAREAQMSVIILDDISSALDTVQTSILGMVRNRRSEGMDFRKSFIALTGNVGDQDGTMTQPGTSALSGRCTMAYLEDDVDLFSKRMHRKFGADDLGDAHISAYLALHQSAFSPKASQMTERDQPRPQPRTWEKLAGDMRSLVHIYNTFPNSPLFDTYKSSSGLQGAVKQMAAEHVGMEAAVPFAAFVQSMMSETFPLARQIFERGLVGTDRLLEQVIERAGRGQRNDGVRSEAAFQFQFADACAAITAGRIASSSVLQGGSPDQINDLVRREVGTFLKVMNSPFFQSNQTAYILMANQAQAAASLGRRMLAIPQLVSGRKPSDVILSRQGLRSDVVMEGIIEAVCDTNTYFHEKFGFGIYTQTDMTNNVYAPMTGDYYATLSSAAPSIEFNGKLAAIPGLEAAGTPDLAHVLGRPGG